MSIVEFKEFDQMLLREIILGSNTITKLMLKESEFRKLAVSSFQANAWRKLMSISLILSKRLQALRHQGIIDWDGFAWQVADDGGQCQECKRAGIFALGGTLEHNVPLWEGGTDADKNKELLCVPCYDAKSALEASGRAAFPTV